VPGISFSIIYPFASSQKPCSGSSVEACTALSRIHPSTDSQQKLEKISDRLYVGKQRFINPHTEQFLTAGDDYHCHQAVDSQLFANQNLIIHLRNIDPGDPGDDLFDIVLEKLRVPGFLHVTHERIPPAKC